MALHTDAIDSVRERVAEAADDAEDVGRDVMRAATAYPVASLLVLSAVVIGGSMLVAAMLQDDERGDFRGSPRLTRLASAVSGLGPKATDILNRIRDAAFSFALDRAVDKVDGMFPGFREHYERG